MASQSSHAAVGVIGGSGLYEMERLEQIEKHAISTPFGDPSDEVISGVIDGRKVYFLPRHGVGHRLMPHEINHRANLWALRSLGVRWLISVNAVGSLNETMAPRDIVVPDQLIDRTGTQTQHTFFGEGIVAHVSLADPYCDALRKCLLKAAGPLTENLHDGGTYLCMNGPAFSTRAEANLHRQMGADLIGMTNAPETRLAREAEISAASLAFVTDYDCWKVDEEAVDVDSVIANLHANSSLAKDIICSVVSSIPTEANEPPHRSLDGAIFTPIDAWPTGIKEKLAPILSHRS